MTWQGDRVEKTELWITCERPLEGDGRAVRGFFANLYRNRPEFHNHFGENLVYRHPLIQYKVFGGSALVVGLKGGAYLLKAVPEIEHLEIHHEINTVIKKNMALARKQVTIETGVYGSEYGCEPEFQGVASRCLPKSRNSGTVGSCRS